MAEDTDLSLKNAHLRKNLTNFPETIFCDTCNQEHRIYTVVGRSFKKYSETEVVEYEMKIEYYFCQEGENIIGIKDVKRINDLSLKE